MYSDNKQIRDVADVAARIMAGLPAIEEELKGGQVKIDKNHNGKIDGQDFKILKGEKKGVVKEDDTGYQDRFAVKNGKAVKHNPEKGEHDEPHHVWADSPEHAVRKHATMNKPKTEEVAEGFKFNSHERGAAERLKDMRKNEKEAEKMDKLYSAMRKKREQDKLKKEEVESIDEVKMADLPSTKVQGRSYGSSRPEPHAVDVMKGPKEKELKDIEAEKKKKKFSEMVNLYQEKGLKSLSEMLVKEEPDNEQFTKELEDAKAKSEGKKRNTEIAKGAVQAVKQEETEITDEMIFEVLENAGIDFESLNDEELQEVTNEAYEILDELSKNTLGSYIKKANYAGGMADFKHGRIADKRGDSKEKTSLAATSTKRQKGISTAVNKLSKEEVEQIEELSTSTLASYVKKVGHEGAWTKKRTAGVNSALNKVKQNSMKSEDMDIDAINGIQMSTIEERHMTDDEMEKREKIVKSMKKGMAGFKDRYGDRAKNVMYATANKQAMKD